MGSNVWIRIQQPCCIFVDIAIDESPVEPTLGSIDFGGSLQPFTSFWRLEPTLGSNVLIGIQQPCCIFVDIAIDVSPVEPTLGSSGTH